MCFVAFCSVASQRSPGLTGTGESHKNVPKAQKQNEIEIDLAGRAVWAAELAPVLENASNKAAADKTACGYLAEGRGVWTKKKCQSLNPWQKASGYALDSDFKMLARFQACSEK